MVTSEWYLYMIRCDNNALYTGITTDVDKRFQTHLDGKGAKYLRGQKNLTLVFSSKVGSHSKALKLEAKIKKLNKQKKEKIIAAQAIDFLSF